MVAAFSAIAIRLGKMQRGSRSWEFAENEASREASPTSRTKERGAKIVDGCRVLQNCE